MAYQFSRSEISNRIEEICAHVAILSKEKKILEDSILFLEDNFNEQHVTTKTKLSTRHLNSLQNMILEIEFRSKIGTNWNNSNSTWVKVCQIFSVFQAPMRKIEIAILIARMDGREDLDKLWTVLSSLFQFKMRKGILASIRFSKKCAKYYLIKSKISTEHYNIFQDTPFEVDFREKIGTRWNNSDSNWNKVSLILSVFQRSMRIIEIVKLIARMDGREDLGNMTRTIESLFQFKIKKGVLASIRFSKRHAEYYLIK